MTSARLEEETILNGQVVHSDRKMFVLPFYCYIEIYIDSETKSVYVTWEIQTYSYRLNHAEIASHLSIVLPSPKIISSWYHLRLRPSRSHYVCSCCPLVIWLLETNELHLILLKRSKLILITVKDEHMCSRAVTS